VIYKASKNLQKMTSALAKHQKKLMRFAEETIVEETEDYVIGQSNQAFVAIRKYFLGDFDPRLLQEAIEPAVMIQRMLNKAREIYDNQLVVDEYSIEENLVAIIRSYAVFDYLKAILEAEPNNYTINAKVLCAANYGAPQKRMRFIVMGIKNALAPNIKLPEGSFTEENYRTVRDAIEDLEDVIPVTDIVNDTGTVLAKKSPKSSLGKQLRNTDCLYNHIVTNTGTTAMERFQALKQGQNFHSLDESMKVNTYTDVSRTQNTIYLRLDYDQPSGTVVNVRKSMWVHPVLNRAVSIREAARLQTFPDSFVFCGGKDQQYQQVGNAVPPIMAKAIAKKLATQLKKSLQQPET